FRDTRPCTNVPIRCPLECNQIHWKYNFQSHLEERHPQWRQILPSSLVSTIQINSAEQLNGRQHSLHLLPCGPTGTNACPVVVVTLCSSISTFNTHWKELFP
ncbi:hypothetical protein B0H10DRAFT_2081471, partial [Mycena sp. CBHHK59/15]